MFRRSAFVAARRPLRRTRRGSIMFLALLMIVVCLAAAALCVDVAYMQLVQTQLRNSTDAATRAGALGLSQGSVKVARKNAKKIAKANRVAGAPLVLEDSDIIFGTAVQNSGSWQRYDFTPSSTDINALRIDGRRTEGSPSGGVTLFLGPKLFGTGAFEPSKVAAAAVSDRDIVLVVDRSGSMDAEDSGKLRGSLKSEYGTDPTYDDDDDGKLRRIEALKVAVREFRKVIDKLPSAEQLGLVSYNTTSRTEADLNDDYGLFDSKIYDMEIGGRTNIGAGIDEAVTMLQNPAFIRPTAVPVIVVMTDGRHNETRDPEDAARDAMNTLRALTIHTVTFSDGADVPRMQSVATIGNGIHVHAEDASELVETFEQMARTAGVVMIQ